MKTESFLRTRSAAVQADEPRSRVGSGALIPYGGSTMGGEGVMCNEHDNAVSGAHLATRQCCVPAVSRR
jgi:hypothetical protein